MEKVLAVIVKADIIIILPVILDITIAGTMLVDLCLLQLQLPIKIKEFTIE